MNTQASKILATLSLALVSLSTKSPCSDGPNGLRCRVNYNIQVSQGVENVKTNQKAKVNNMSSRPKRR